MIAVEHLTIRVGAFALVDVSFAIPSGQYAVLMGRTGSGKTTLMEALCGLKRVTSGTIRLNERDVTRLKPAERGIGYVPQDAALFSTMTVREHLAFPLMIRQWNRTEIDPRVGELANLLGLTKLLDRKPPGLSGGEAQRVALGRALAFRPSILCLDEPLSALDEATKDDMYKLLLSVQAYERVTAVHVTHNREDADELADVLLRIEGGKVIT